MESSSQCDGSAPIIIVGGDRRQAIDANGRAMKRDQVVALLKRHETEFRNAGVGALFLFGSVARDEAHDASDVDLFLDLEQPRGFTLFDLVALQQRMQDILGAKVDLMTRRGIHPRRRSRIEAAAVRVF
jgi:predicted nucleotidyltransferase